MENYFQTFLRFGFVLIISKAVSPHTDKERGNIANWYPIQSFGIYTNSSQNPSWDHNPTNTAGNDLDSFISKSSGNARNVQETPGSSESLIGHSKNKLLNSKQNSQMSYKLNPKLNRLAVAKVTKETLVQNSRQLKTFEQNSRYPTQPLDDLANPFQNIADLPENWFNIPTNPTDNDLETSKTQRSGNPRKIQQAAFGHSKNSLLNSQQSRMKNYKPNPKIRQLNCLDVSKDTKKSLGQNSQELRNPSQHFRNPKDPSLHVVDLLQNWYHYPTKPIENDQESSKTQRSGNPRNVQQTTRSSEAVFGNSKNNLQNFMQNHLEIFETNPMTRQLNGLDVNKDLNPTENELDSSKTQRSGNLRKDQQTNRSSKFNSQSNLTNFVDITTDLFHIRKYSTNIDKFTFYTPRSWNFKKVVQNIRSFEGNLTENNQYSHVKRKRSPPTTTLKAEELVMFQERSRKPAKIFKILQENLKSLESLLRVDTLVLYGRQEILSETLLDFQENLPPLLIVTSLTNKELRYNFNSNILSLVFLGSEEYPPLNNLLLNIVNKSLNRRHLEKLILITDSVNVKDKGKFLPLFNWLHKEGFWNSLLLDREGNSLTFDHLKGLYIRNMTVREFLLKTLNWQDLQNFPIRCSMGSNPPRAYVHRDAQKQVTLKGYYGTIINLFAKYYNASLKPYVLSDAEYYTELDCVKYINERKVDICGDVLTIHTEYVVTNPDEISSSYLMVPYDKPLARFYYFLKPFHLSVWTIVNCSFFYKVVTLSFIHRLQHGTWNASLQMLYAVLSVMFLPFHLTHVKGAYRKFLEFLMILVGFVVANWYLSVLSSLLFTRLYSHDIKSLKDLAHHNISIMVNEFDVYLLNSTINDPIIMQQLLVVTNDVLLQHRRNLDPHYAYYSQSDKIEFYLHQQKFLLRPRMKVLTGIPPINEVLAGIPMSPNWPFQHLLNGFMRRILDSGLYQRLLVTAREEGIVNGYLHYFPTEHHYVEPLSIEYFQMPAMLLAVGYSLALVGFLLEIYVFK